MNHEIKVGDQFCRYGIRGNELVLEWVTVEELTEKSVRVNWSRELTGKWTGGMALRHFTAPVEDTVNRWWGRTEEEAAAIFILNETAGIEAHQVEIARRVDRINQVLTLGRR